MGPARLRPLLAAALAAGILVGGPAAPAEDAPDDSRTEWISERLAVQTSGHGEPELIFLSDLAMPTAVWDHVVARFEVAYRCHVVLPAGFGDKPSGWTNPSSTRWPMPSSPTRASRVSPGPSWSATASAGWWH